VSGTYQDKNGDGKVAWYADPAMPNEKPPTGQDPKTIQDTASDKPTAESQASNTPLIFGADTEPYASVSSPAETKADFVTAFSVMFGATPSKELISAYSNELRSLQASRTNVKVNGIVTQGVSAQERKNILDKYLKSYATRLSDAAKQGDAKASEALKKGNFGLVFTTIRNAYAENGLPFNQNALINLTTESAINPDKLNANLNLVKLQAQTYFPALADKIKDGYTVKQLLSPYINTRANVLEEDPDMIDVKSLQSIAKDPNNLMNLYDYEVSLRQDPKWRFTKNAQDSMSSVANGIAKMFGLVG
jgi:hypothetical protein